MCVCALQEGVCVRHQGRLSLVGGGMVKRFGLPSLSYHQGCESQIKLSLSSFLSFIFHSFPPHPSLFHTLVAFLLLYLQDPTFISSAICLSLPQNFHLSCTFSAFCLAPYLLVNRFRSTNHACRLHTHKP